MGTYIKTLTFGPTSGGRMVRPEEVDAIVNKALDSLKDAGATILDVRIALASTTAGNYVSKYVIIYGATQPAP